MLGASARVRHACARVDENDRVVPRLHTLVPYGMMIRNHTPMEDVMPEPKVQPVKRKRKAKEAQPPASGLLL